MKTENLLSVPAVRAAFAINGKSVDNQSFIDVATDPRRSIAVEACAGSGKTWMLIERMIRALQSGAASDEILAITFTKKAAGEMRERLQERLQAPELKELRRRILESGRSVQILNFHSWFAQLFKAVPLNFKLRFEYSIDYELLEDSDVLLPELRHAFYSEALINKGLQIDLAALIEELGRTKVDDALVALLAKLTEFELADEQGLVEQSVEDAIERAVDLDLLARLAKLLGLYKTDELKNAATSLETAISTSNFSAIALALLTKEQAPRKFKSKISDEDRIVLRAGQGDVLAVLAAQHQHASWLYQQRMTRVGRVWLACFAKLKRDRGLIDMSDLERAATLMLSDPEVSGAVQERLDQRIRHVLIDEFQDTSPLQWQAMHAWLASYAGSGGGLNRPSLFIVGDPKQSIYRFRNAEPRVFAAAQVFMRDTFDADLLTCDHTRRCAIGVVDVVNAAMTAAQEAGEYAGFRAHTTESTSVGSALCLPLIERVKKVKDESLLAKLEQTESTWRDSLSTPREDAEESLKEREATQAAAWIASNCAAQSVLVLSRTHEPLGLIQQSLQQYGVPATRLEKNNLSDVPAVQDVLSLLNFLVSPSSDLDLARALKSPLFAYSDQDLMAIRTQQLAAMPERASWFEVVEGETKNKLLRWQAWLSALPPHDALQAIYDDADIYNKYLTAIPSAMRQSSHAALQALLWAALQAAGGRFLSGYGFVRAMRAKVQTIKAPVVSDSTTSVQLLTVHGAKGLQADVVVLLGSDAQKRNAASMTTLVDWQPEDPAPKKFVFLQSESNPPTCAADLLAADIKARELEELNALYVAMTRAKQTLVLSASEAKNFNAKSVWNRLQSLCTPAAENKGSPAKPDAAWPEPISLEVPFDTKNEPTTLLTLPIVGKATATEVSNEAAKRGSALHRLLQWQSTDATSVAAIASEFGLSVQDAKLVQSQAHAMLNGEAAWLWDESKIDWQANEYELLQDGRVLRIDRLVRHRETGQWWVIDFKSALAPEKSAALREQLNTYRGAVAKNIHVPLGQVQTAFVIGEGRLVSLSS